VKLLFDQNLSYRLVAILDDIYPGSVHVRDINLATADDGIVWEHARNHGLTIVSKDSDFHQRSFLFGPPPKVIWIQKGNCATSAIEKILRGHREDLRQFINDADAAFLTLE
jgi:predicted nuclease of predicted toxin-antitoxin system